jgi:hypothetical protein
VLPDKQPLRDAHHGLAHQYDTFKIDELYLGEGRTCNVYKIPDPAWQYMNEYVENVDSMLPCGHRGISNTPDGYACQLDLCDKLFTREEVDA